MVSGVCATIARFYSGGGDVGDRLQPQQTRRFTLAASPSKVPQHNPFIPTIQIHTSLFPISLCSNPQFPIPNSQSPTAQLQSSYSPIPTVYLIHHSQARANSVRNLVWHSQVFQSAKFRLLIWLKKGLCDRDTSANIKTSNKRAIVAGLASYKHQFQASRMVDPRLRGDRKVQRISRRSETILLKNKYSDLHLPTG